MRKEISIETTADGSHTLYSTHFNQHYHNPNGAVSESKHNFFRTNGLYNAIGQQSKINILEVGFGSGLNLLLLMDALLNLDTQPAITYHSIEAYPISAETASSFNFGEYLDHPELTDELPAIFGALEEGMNLFKLFPYLTVHIFFGLFDEYTPGDTAFDFIFHDAFSPAVNPGLWSGDVFKKLLQCCRPHAVLTTYSAASKARGGMAWARWKVARAQGALGKREMTVASSSAEPLSHLERVNERRLARRYAENNF